MEPCGNNGPPHPPTRLHTIHTITRLRTIAARYLERPGKVVDGEGAGGEVEGPVGEPSQRRRRVQILHSPAETATARGQGAIRRQLVLVHAHAVQGHVARLDTARRQVALEAAAEVEHAQGARGARREGRLRRREDAGVVLCEGGARRGVEVLLVHARVLVEHAWPKRVMAGRRGGRGNQEKGKKL